MISSLGQVPDQVPKDLKHSLNHKIGFFSLPPFIVLFWNSRSFFFFFCNSPSSSSSGSSGPGGPHTHTHTDTQRHTHTDYCCSVGHCFSVITPFIMSTWSVSAEMEQEEAESSHRALRSGVTSGVTNLFEAESYFIGTKSYEELLISQILICNKVILESVFLR